MSEFKEYDRVRAPRKWIFVGVYYCFSSQVSKAFGLIANYLHTFVN